ncbi:MAG TPA: glycerol dehydratase reactivase beta/small subunit family protein [Chloroflexaceae bacterium]|nr:glycerol dehydratase reactivase beta/small subunit family protein [Chloroflexaceae bacterium]
MADQSSERPAIHVCLAGPSAPGLYAWAEVGAEEEGLPTRHVVLAESDVTAAAYAAAQGSRFGIGVAIGQGRVVLHEAHMPPEHPVLAFALGADAARACRLMGGNAARLVVRLPLRLGDEAEEVPEPPSPPDPVSRERKRGGRHDVGEPLDIAQVARIAGAVARILRERGIA